MEIPNLGMPGIFGATTFYPSNHTILRLPYDGDRSDYPHLPPQYTSNEAAIRLIATEACQSLMFVSSPQDTLPRSYFGHEIFCNSYGWWLALNNAGASLEEAAAFLGTFFAGDPTSLVYNPIPPATQFYDMTPQFGEVFN
jgi:hypothetical protein